MTPSDNRGAQFLRRNFSAHGAQSELAERTGITQSWLSRIFRGAQPNLQDGIALHRETGCEPNWFREEPLPDSDKGAAE